MNRKVLIKVQRERCSDYAILDIRLADKDCTLTDREIAPR